MLILFAILFYFNLFAIFMQFLCNFNLILIYF